MRRVGQVNLCVETINPSCGGWGGGYVPGGAKGRALGGIDVGVCYTRGARSRPWCGWLGRRGRCGRRCLGIAVSGIYGSETITRRYPGRESVYCSGDFDIRWGVYTP